MSHTGYKRVYISNGAYFFVDRGKKWHRLCAVTDGEPAMLRALAKVKDAPATRPGSMAALIADWKREELPNYAEATRYDYGLMLNKIEAAFRDCDVADVDAGDILDLREQWRTKPRSANKYQSLLSLLMAFAIVKRQRTTNPTFEVRKLKTKKRKRYVTHEEMLKVRAGAINGRRVNKDGKPWTNANGAMMAALLDFAYLTALRAADVRLLTWSQVGEREILVEPSKTRHSSDAKMSVTITPEIQAVLDRVRNLGKVKGLTVFHTLKGAPFSASAIKSAWRRARERAGVTDVRFRDLRPKALSDALRNGLSLEKIKDGAGHASVTTTEDYMRCFEVKEAALGLALPKAKKSV